MITVKIIDIKTQEEVLAFNNVIDVKESIISGAAAIVTEKVNNIVRVEAGQFMRIITNEED